MYNFHAVKTGKLAPDGWRVATDDDWSTLTTYTSSVNQAGKLKHQTLWDGDVTSPTDEYGFSAVPGGIRNYEGTYAELDTTGRYWTSDEHISGSGWIREMGNMSFDVFRTFWDPVEGLSVRCILGDPKE
jgi:uncharacterized protein (TIGR02145 family)